ncbi:hypothetical protein PMKS-001125 [Pichia membranifaciens]|uniref:Thioredoxin domain-containing protein n=1 Tax=Pichia membranifaciens TaxID=4926 RepID=A0A1Q2YDM7_9ASCO|nr:hypothetical protein PMKS-001125 [Pichia membranifaciens]
MWHKGSVPLDGEQQPQNTMKTANLVLQLISLLLLALCPQKVDAALSVDELKKSVSDSNPIYDVPDGQLKDIVTGLKPYGLILLVTTADPRFGCDLCGQFEPVYAKIVQAVYQKYPALKNEAFFLRVEAANHLEYLKELGVTSVPRVWGFPNSKGVLGEEKFNKVKSLLEEQKQALASGGVFIEPEWYDLKQAGMEHFVFELAKGDNWEAVIAKFAGFLSNTLHVDVNAALVEVEGEAHQEGTEEVDRRVEFELEEHIADHGERDGEAQADGDGQGGRQEHGACPEEVCQKGDHAVEENDEPHVTRGRELEGLQLEVVHDKEGGPEEDDVEDADKAEKQLHVDAGVVLHLELEQDRVDAVAEGAQEGQHVAH